MRRLILFCLVNALPVLGNAAEGAAPARSFIWSTATADTFLARFPDPDSIHWVNQANHFSWQAGYAMFTFEKLWRLTGDARYFDYIKRYVDQQVDGQGNVPNFSPKALDNFPSGLCDPVHVRADRPGEVQGRRDQDPGRLSRLPQELRRQLLARRVGPAPGLGRRCLHGPDVPRALRRRHGRPRIRLRRGHPADEACARALPQAERPPPARLGRVEVGELGGQEDRPGVRGMERGARLVRPPDRGRFRLPAKGQSGPRYAAFRTQKPVQGPQVRPGPEDRNVVPGGRQAGRPGNWNETSGTGMYIYLIKSSIDRGFIDRAEYLPVVEQAYAGIITKASVETPRAWSTSTTAAASGSRTITRRTSTLRRR